MSRTVEVTELLEQIEAAKSQVQEETGSFKYDFAFEMIEDIIRNK